MVIIITIDQHQTSLKSNCLGLPLWSTALHSTVSALFYNDDDDGDGGGGGDGGGDAEMMVICVGLFISGCDYDNYRTDLERWPL